MVTLLAISLTALVHSQMNESTRLPISITNQAPTGSPYVRMFQIQNRSSDPSPWLIYPANNKTVWVVTIAYGIQPLSQIVNFTRVSATVAVSTPVANLTDTLPTDIVYDHVEDRLWIVANDSLVYYNQTARAKITIAQTFTNGGPWYLAIDSQDHLWLTLLEANQIVEYNPSNGRSYYSPASSNAGLQGIAVSPVDGSVWFAEAYLGGIGRLVPCNSPPCPITEYSPPSGITLRGVSQLAVDKTGIIWFTVHDGNEFGSFNPSTRDWKLFPIGYCSDNYVAGCEVGLPNAIALDPSGKVWFSEHYTGRIGRYDPTSETLAEYAMPTTSPVCGKVCPPLSWWMWPGQNGLVWFVAFDLGEIGYVNSTLPIPFTVSSVESVTVNQGTSVSFPVSAGFVGEAPSLNASVTSLDTSSNPAMLSWSLSHEKVSSATGIADSFLTLSASWASTLGSRYIAASAYNENLTLSVFVKVDVVASLAYATIGFASGISTFAVAALVLNRYSTKKKQKDTARSDWGKSKSN
jgi:streptogramin lyase